MRGIGVAVSTSRSGRSPLAKNADRCFTPNLCCSSITQRDNRDSLAFSAKRACVPTVILGKSPTGPGLESDVHVTTSSIPRGSSFRKEAACCSTKRVVGAINATWVPCSNPLKRAWAATKVLPAPTSPWSKRCIGRGKARSSSISPHTFSWSPVIGQGSDFLQGPTRSLTFSGLSTRMDSRAARRTRRVNCIPSNSSWAKLRRAISTSRSDPGKCRVRQASALPGRPSAPGNASSTSGQNSFK